MDIPNNQPINPSPINKVITPPVEPPKPRMTFSPFLKYFFLFLFIFLPFYGFYLGMKYKENTTIPQDYSYLRIMPTRAYILPTITKEEELSIKPSVFISTISPTPTVIINKETGWKIFQTQTFSFEYPPDWEIINDWDRASYNRPTDTPSQNVVFLRSSDLNQAMFLEFSLNGNFDGACGDLIKSDSPSIDGLVGKRAIWRGVDCEKKQNSQIFMSLDKNNDHYAFLFSLKSKDEGVGEAIFDKIIKTFKFIE